MPAFISILVFKGLFNQNFGELNLILGALFGITPNWNTDPLLAQIMLIFVNVWLGYPYMMLLSMGFLQSVPEDHKKAAALEGASPLRVVLHHHPAADPAALPAAADLELRLQLQQHRPHPAADPRRARHAGHRDPRRPDRYPRLLHLPHELQRLLGQQFGLAGAITLIIFIIVTVIAYTNFVALRRAAAEGGLSHDRRTPPRPARSRRSSPTAS